MEYRIRRVQAYTAGNLRGEGDGSEEEERTKTRDAKVQ